MGSLDTQPKSFSIEKLFGSVLKVSTEISRLTPTSREMMLIAFNAEPAAVRAGEDGRSLRVITRHINELANTITEQVHIILHEITECTDTMANYSTMQKKQAALLRYLELDGVENADEMRSAIRENNRAHMQEYAHQLTEDCQILLARIPDQLRKVDQAFTMILDQIRTGEMVTVSIEIESASAKQSSAVETFYVLAGKLREASKDLRQGAERCNYVLRNVREQYRMIQSMQQRSAA